MTAAERSPQEACEGVGTVRNGAPDHLRAQASMTGRLDANRRNARLARARGPWPIAQEVLAKCDKTRAEQAEPSGDAGRSPFESGTGIRRVCRSPLAAQEAAYAALRDFSRSIDAATIGTIRVSNEWLDAEGTITTFADEVREERFRRAGRGPRRSRHERLGGAHRVDGPGARRRGGRSQMHHRPSSRAGQH